MITNLIDIGSSLSRQTTLDATHYSSTAIFEQVHHKNEQQKRRDR
jgi:hypothetical protein